MPINIRKYLKKAYLFFDTFTIKYTIDPTTPNTEPSKVNQGVVFSRYVSSFPPAYTKMSIVATIWKASPEYFNTFCPTLLSNSAFGLFCRIYWYRSFTHLTLAIEFSTRFNHKFIGMYVAYDS